MNATLDTTFETDFNTALNMSSQKYDYNELIMFLTSDKIVEKQIAALQLKEIKSLEDAMILVSNLIGQDGKVREAVAFKINELAHKDNFSIFFSDEKIFDILIKGIMDINGNVCRQIINLTDLPEFKEYLCEKLPFEINKILNEIKKLDSNNKQYVISKRNFQLYWALEALYYIIDLLDIKDVKEILLQTGIFEDYTIREKTAKILSKIDDEEFISIKEKLKNDENYYVKRYFC